MLNMLDTQDKLKNFSEAQLIKENIVQMDDLNKPPFSMDGGIKRLDKIFKNETKEIIEELNNYLYLQA